MKEKKIVPIELIREATESIKASSLIRTPLIRLNLPHPTKKIYLKCENLQPYGSFKARGACFAINKLSEEKLAAGICTASSGNFAQGVGLMAQEAGVGYTVVVPDNIPQTKLSKVEALGGNVIKVPYAKWWKAISTAGQMEEGNGATTLHCSDLNVLAGHGTIGLEILEDLPEVDTIVSPYGSGGLIAGVSSVMRERKPDVRVLACEPTVASPLKLALERGEITEVPNHQQTFVDGMGGKIVFKHMWPYVNHLVDGSVPVTLEQIVDAVRLIMDRNSLLAEGAGAATVAAALTDDVPGENIVCIISGGNIDFSKIATICNGSVPKA